MEWILYSNVEELYLSGKDSDSNPSAMTQVCSGPGGIISTTWCPSDPSTMVISYLSFYLRTILLTIPADVAL